MVVFGSWWSSYKKGNFSSWCIVYGEPPTLKALADWSLQEDFMNLLAKALDDGASCVKISGLKEAQRAASNGDNQLLGKRFGDVSNGVLF